MNFACDKCQRRYTLPDEKVRGKIVKVRCKNCQSLISVGPLREVDLDAVAAQEGARSPSPSPARAGQAAPWDDEPTRAVPKLDKSVPWFALVKGQQVGPFDFAALDGQIRSGEIGQRTYLWAEGMPDWKRAQDLPELQQLFTAGVTQKPPAPKKPEPMSPTTAVPQRKTSAGRAAQATTSPFNEVTRAVSSQELFDQAGAAALSADVTVPRALSPAAQAARATSAKAKVEVRPSEPTLPAGDLGGELFSDLDLTSKKAELSADEAHAATKASADEGKKKKKKKEPEPEEDPFAQLADLDPNQLPPANESTSFFIAQAGVNKRNPPWKIAAMIGGFLGVPLILLYTLSAMQVVKLEVTQEDAEGNEVKAPVFSSQGLTGLGRTLLGNKKAKPAAAPEAHPRPHVRVVANNLGSASNPGSAAGTAHATSSVGTLAAADDVDLVKGKKRAAVSPDLKALYEDTTRKDVGPSLHKTVAVADDTSSPGGPPQEVVAKVVSQTQPAFQFCIEQQLKKNPSFRGGKVSLVATVAASGIVKKAIISKPDIDVSDLGQCIKTKARRMSFPAFQGDDVDLDIPLILTTTL